MRYLKHILFLIAFFAVSATTAYAVISPPTSQFKKPNIPSDELPTIKNGKLVLPKKRTIPSPIKQFNAVTIEPENSQDQPTTYLTDTKGKQITPPYSGRFLFWSPDGKKAFLFIQNPDKKGGRIQPIDAKPNPYYQNLPDYIKKLFDKTKMPFPPRTK